MSSKRQLSGGALVALEDFLASDVHTPLHGGTVQILFTPLPGRTACVAVVVEGVLWIALDDGKPWARGQVAEMIADSAPAAYEAVRGWFRAIPEQGGRRMPTYRLEGVG